MGPWSIVFSGKSGLINRGLVFVFAPAEALDFICSVVLLSGLAERRHGEFHWEAKVCERGRENGLPQNYFQRQCVCKTISFIKF